MKNKLFVLVRKDLEISYRAVMAGHAVAQWMLSGNLMWKNEYLIYLDIENEEELTKWKDKFEMKCIDYTPFHEPDLGNQLVSIAIHGNENLFKKLKLMQK